MKGVLVLDIRAVSAFFRGDSAVKADGNMAR